MLPGAGKLIVSLSRTPGEPLADRYLGYVYQPMCEADGSTSGVIALGVDVTERRLAEQALLQSEKLAAVGRLASSIAHEINNPLEFVTNLLYLARRCDDFDDVRSYLVRDPHRECRSAWTARFHETFWRTTGPMPGQQQDAGT